MWDFIVPSEVLFSTGFDLLCPLLILCPDGRIAPLIYPEKLSPTEQSRVWRAVGVFDFPVVLPAVE